MVDNLSPEPQTQPVKGSGGAVSFWLPRKRQVR